MSMAVLTPQEQEVEFLEAGEVGYMMAGIKTVEDARVGDTITHESESRRALQASVCGLQLILYADLRN